MDGSEDTASIGVGAHQAHVLGAALGRPVACAECHLVPKAENDPGHVDTPLPAEVVFGPLATSSAATPVWNREAMTCAGSYCHGATLGGGINKVPKWNVVDHSQSMCGSCHGLPPPAPHPASTACNLCHAPVVGANMTIVAPLRHADGVLDVREGAECSGCHGSDTNAAPPFDLSKRSETTRRSVGAHQAHLEGGVLSKPIACGECHLVPRLLNDPGHVDTSTPAEVVFGVMAKADGAQPAWDRGAATCANNYCHGATLEGGPALAAPSWTLVNGTQAACGSCHGLPPPAPHPAQDRCEMCHLPTAGPNKTVANRATHVDGIVQVSSTDCRGCHGTAASLAPPTDTAMRSDTALMSVGAHATHLSGGRNAKPVACTDCHLVPTELNSVGHVDSPLPAELVFSGAATARNAHPRFDAASGKCSNTYCHGASLSGGTNTSPSWTIVDGTQTACGACHGLPPPLPHPTSTQCQACHSPTAGPGLTIASAATHIDGVVQTSSGDCLMCHGSMATGSSSPPLDTGGGSDSARRGVGAHASHINATLGIARPVACSECHLVPVDRDSPGHVDSQLPAEITFGPVARSNGAGPAYDPATQTCRNNYCHGATLPGGRATSPLWTRVDGSQASCGSCHGIPPPAPHPSDLRCELCHLPTAGSNQTIADASTHLDGIIQVTAGCDGCHGSGGNSAPPSDLDHNTATTFRGVGAHRAHLDGGVFSKALACTECHLVPAELDSPGHRDTPRPAELNFGALSTAKGHASRYAAGTCSDSYCHSGVGASAPNPDWTKVDGTQAACGGCHAIPPATPVHTGQTECTGCHLPTAGPNRTIANRATHVDGILQVTVGDCMSCHGMGNSSAPPKDLHNDLLPTDPQVGAHAVHLSGGSVSTAVACDDCHLVPTELNSPGHVDSMEPAEVVFSGRSSANLSTPVYSSATHRCTNTYCHGAQSSGGSNPNPLWNAPGTAGCGSCHGLPPAAPHPPGNNCESCHAPTAGPGMTIASAATHVDGIVQVTAGDCSSCHGSMGNPAPPKDLGGGSDTTQRSVGAHASHLNATLGIAAPVACAQCHVVPAQLNSPGHIDSALPAEVSFAPLSSTDGATPMYNAAAGTCATYCHGVTLPGGAITAPVWNRVDGSQASCGSCHGLPPAAPHPADSRCELCHLPTAGSNQTIANAATHIDGVLQVAANCDGCHGSGGNSAPPSDLDHNTATTLLGVGAHREHLAGGAFSRPLACSECHLVPLTLDAPGHRDTPRPAELNFGALSKTKGHASTYASGTCSDSYCHSGVGASAPNPTWTQVDGTQAACGGCHAIPPATPVHTGQTECTACHLPTAGPGRTIANRATHVDGVVQVTAVGCTTCHGMGSSSAPPMDLNHDTLATDPQVGAHAVHLSGGAVSSAVACTTCHLVPVTLDDPGHVDSMLPAEVTFSGRAAAMLSTPTWSTANKRCSNTYCHGAQSSGGSNPNPLWNAPGTSGCGSCHGLPPSAPHPAANNCEACHAPTAGPGMTIASASTHVDGILQVIPTDCSSCHGSMGNPAPPKDTNGGSDTTTRGVGAHASHINAPLGIAAPVLCTECHLVPADLNSPGHIDTTLPAEVNLGPLSRSAGATPMYDPATQSCTTYCHGLTLPDGAVTMPQWTRVDGSQASCGSCHGNPPGAPHPSDTRCELCHLPTAGPNRTIANAATHIDGVLQSTSGCDSCHGGGGSSAPPNDLDGSADTTRLTVGAHRSHLNGGAISRAVPCNECHLVPAENNSPGHVDTPRPAEVVFGPLSNQGPHTASYAAGTCADSYCHSGVGASTPVPSWTRVDGSQVTCGGCHAIPPATPVHQNQTECTGCHLPTAGPGRTIANRSTHVDGVLQVTALTCMTCHGMGSQSAPPVDLDMNSAATDRQVGAHAVHMSGGAVSTPVACNNCHLVPLDTNSPGHIDTARPAEVIFGGRASANLSQPVYTAATLTCANTYCHGATSSLGTNPDPVWNVPGSAGCGTCHGLPPAAPHPQVDKCEVCHAATSGPNHTIANRTRHIDGIVDVDEQRPCELCHGSVANAAPPLDLNGAMTSAGVGAHQRHMLGTANSKAVPCGECHAAVMPATPNQAGHYDTPRPVEMIFGALARQGGQNPDLNAGSCRNTYCHGVGIAGGTNKNPGWTQGAQTCSSCHGMPPPDADHGNGTATQCDACHSDVAGPGQTIRNAARHVDGVVDTAASCDACHGGGGDATPPRDLTGRTTGPKVGVHQAHRAPTIAAAVACSDCHLVPATYSAAGHADTPPPAEVGLIGRAAMDGATPTYTAATETCNNTYCHGVTMPGGKTQVRWDDVSGAERACTACHGMPPASPAHNGQGPNSCQGCHAEVAGPGQTIATPALHVDGVVQSSGGGCDSCHGSPPAPGRESYPGTAGAHAQHAGTLGYECAICHGNNGSGPQHDQGNGTVIRANVNISFAASFSYPGGTTMRNGQANTVYTAATKTCQVGCHNPVVNNPNETPSLSNQVAWGAGPLTCLSCHEGVATTVPRNHAINGQGDAACRTCHDLTNHTQGTRRLRDPDPADGIAANSVDNLCRTCHDGTGGTAFNNQAAVNALQGYASSAHGARGYNCTQCHSYHSAATTGPLFVDTRSTTCMAAGCHANLSTEFGQVPAGPISHHRIEGGTGIAINCNDCHNAHLSRASPNAAVNPDNKWAIYAMPTTARTQRRSAGDYRAFCLACHDGTPPPGVTGALNIQSALNGGTEPTQFKTNDGSQHRKNHSGYNCQNCHGWHGTTGSAGTNRGRMLYNYINVRTFPYTGKNSCGTTPGANGFNFNCH